MAIVDLDFPYLIPLHPGNKAEVFDVASIKGFWGNTEPDSWNATGFKVTPGDNVYSSRSGIVTEIVGSERTDEPISWYHTWNYALTVLQPDGTLIVYKNVDVKNKDIKVGERIVSSQYIGEVKPRSNELLLVLFQHALKDNNPRFIIPQFTVNKNNTELLVPSKTYEVDHPFEIVSMEMTKKEIRQLKRQK